MGLEVATSINALNANNPSGLDGKAQGDDHIRLIKSVLKATFPNQAGAFNRVINVSSARTFAATDVNSIIAVDGSGSAVTLTVPALVDLGTSWVVKVLAINGNVTIDMTGSEQINGDGEFFVPTGSYVEIISIGTALYASSNIFSGAIVMKEGLIADIPPGWDLCDGTNGTPDLTDKFVVGAGDTYAVGATGGSADAIVVSHTHGMFSAGAHNHSFRVLGSQWGAATTDPTGGANAQVGTVTTSTAGDHSHVITSTGSSATNANLPPYYALFFIRKK